MQEFEHEKQILKKYKRCPYCYTTLRLDATFCLECKKKIGKADKFGLAKKPFNIKTYLAAILWAILFFIYIWKIFIERLWVSAG